eukprot:jgi/Mesvir1/1377/Mv21649-RA.1
MSSSNQNSVRYRKVEEIFKLFDKNKDGRLNREEMAAMVQAVNPSVRFSEEQIAAVLEEVFRGYGEFIDDDRGLSLMGLCRTYDEGAGDVDRDFAALGLSFDGGLSPSLDADKDDEAVNLASPKFKKGSHVEEFQFLGTRALLSELEGTIKKLGDTSVDQAPWAKKALYDLRHRADAANEDESFEGHMAMGHVLSGAPPHLGLVIDAYVCYDRAVELKPHDPRAHFRLGNALFALGKYDDARREFETAMKVIGSQGDSPLLPQVHVNLGITLEKEGMLMGACEHYREAAILNPSHHRAVKLLGSALYGLGELRAAEEALKHALHLCKHYPDAQCDLASTLRGLGEEEKAREAFLKALDMEPNHIEALYNLGNLQRDAGEFLPAVDLYSKVLIQDPTHWKAQLNKAVSLLGAGRGDEARAEFKKAFKLTNRVELYDALRHLRRLSKRYDGLSFALANVDPHEGEEDEDGFGPVEGKSILAGTKFSRSSVKTTTREDMAAALDVRSFQRHCHFNLCPVKRMHDLIDDSQLPPGSGYGGGPAGGGGSDKLVRKAALEKVLRKLLDHATNVTFQGAMKSINERLLSVLDKEGRGVVDFAHFIAVVAPLLHGSTHERKRVVFDALLWRRGSIHDQVLPRRDLVGYFELLDAMYRKRGGGAHLLQTREPTYVTAGGEGKDGVGMGGGGEVSFKEFSAYFDGPQGFTLLVPLRKLEDGDRIRHHGLKCSVCMYSIIGPRYHCVNANFDLCIHCYCEGKVPPVARRDEYVFKERLEDGYVNAKLRKWSSGKMPKVPPQAHGEEQQ